MIISHKHRFVFLRSCKTGSTSTALAIRQSGILDIQTDLSSVVEGPVRHPFHRPLNLPSENPPDSLFAEVAPHTLVWQNPAKRLIHLNLAELVDLGFLTAEQAREYVIYVGIREPLDKMISAANFLLRRAPDGLFRQHNIARPDSVQAVIDQKVIDVIMPILTMPQAHWFDSDSADQYRFLVFEDLPNAVAAMIALYGGDWSVDRMPDKKSGLRDRQVHTAENLLRPDTVEQLRDTYQRDFELWQAACDDPGRWRIDGTVTTKKRGSTQ